MKNNKIIIIFIAIILAMSGGYLVYNNNQKVSSAQYYYGIGDYKKASDLAVGEVSDKASILLRMSDWKSHGKDVLSMSSYISSLDSEINYIKPNDDKFINMLKSYYQDIASYLGVTTTKLDEINKMDSKSSQEEVQKLIDNII